MYVGDRTCYLRIRDPCEFLVNLTNKPGNNAKMYNIMRLNHGSLKRSLNILATARRCYSQQILLTKPVLTRVLCNSRNALSLEGSKKYFSSLSSIRSHVCVYNERIIGQRKLHNSAWKKAYKAGPLDVNIAVTNNVMLYKYERPKLFAFMNVFAPVQCVFWIWVAYFIYTKLPERETSLWEYFMEYWGWLIMCGSCIFLGTTSMGLMWAFTSRSIRYLILKAGGKDISVLTYHPLKKNIGITVPISDVSSRIPRKDMTNYLAVKLRGRPFFYILDNGGEFINPKLYDHTVGVIRSFAK